MTKEQEQQQIKRLQAVKADRDSDAVHATLEALRTTAADNEANCSSSVEYVEDDTPGKSCVPPSD